MQKPVKQFTAEQHKEYETLKFTVHVHNESAKKWAECLLEIKNKEYFLIECSSWDQWVEKHCPWTKNTVRLVMREREAERLITETTGEPVISRPHTSTKSESVPCPAQDLSKKDGEVKRTNVKVEVVLTDAGGYPVPKDLEKLWNRSDELNPIATTISDLKCRIEKAWKDEDELFLNVHQDAVSKLHTAYYYLRSARLEYVCGFCQGRCRHLKQECPHCHNLGLMTKEQWERTVPAELKLLREKALKK